MQRHVYDWSTLTLAEPGSVQEYLLDRHRATDAFRREYAEYMLSSQADSDTVRTAVSAARDFSGDAGISADRDSCLIGDMLYARYVLGFKYWEYFSYGLRDLSVGQMLGFLPESGRKQYTKVLNPDRKRNLWFSNKWELYSFMPDLYGRDAVLAGGPDGYKAFLAFLARHPRFLAKPPKGSLGSGVRIFDASRMSGRQAQVLFRRLCGEQQGSLCEELIDQEPAMAAIHPESVNSVRLTTYLSPEGVARPVCAYLRSGRGASVVDNAGAGGVFAAVDTDTGMAATDAVDERGRSYTVHPDTGFVFKGFRVPDWDGLVSAASDAAARVPDIRLIGWDMALSKSGWVVIEGNCQSHVNLVQAATKTGMRRMFELAIEWDRNRTGAKTPALRP